LVALRLVTKNGFVAICKATKIFNHQQYGDQNLVVTKIHFCRHRVSTTKTTPFSIAHEPTPSSQDGF
jgi:hypothetical protein